MAPGSPADRAGLRPGDQVTAWRRTAAFPANPLPAAGLVASPFDLEEALREEAPRGPLELSGLRAGRPFRAELAPGVSPEAAGVESRPELGAGSLAQLAAARSGKGPGDPEGGAENLRRAARLAFAEGDAEGGLWLLRERVRLLEAARSFAAADAAFGEAATAFAIRARPVEAAELRVEWARSLDRRILWEEAEAVLVAAERVLGPAASPLVRARVLHERGEVARHRDDYPAAERFHRNALGLRAAAAPESLEAAASLLGVGRGLAEGSGDPVPYLEAAEAAVRRLDPGSRTHSLWLSYLGQTLATRDAVRAESVLREALALARRREARGYAEALARSRLGALLDFQKSSPEARGMLEEALEMAQGLPDEYLNRFLQGVLLQQLSHVAAGQGDTERAYSLARQSVDALRPLRRESIGLAIALDALGRSAWLLGRWEETRAHYGESLALLERLIPESPAIPFARLMLVRVAAVQGRTAEAEALLERLRPLQGRFASGRHFATFLMVESYVAGRAGRLDAAIERGRDALAFLDLLDPEHLDLVEALTSLAFWERKAGQREAYREHACRGVDLLERRAELYGADEEARLRLARGYAETFVLCAEALLGEGRKEAAFRAVEAGRARALLDLLVRRDLDFGAAPASLRVGQEELVRRREELAAELEAAGGDGERAAELRRGLEALRAEQERLSGEAYRSAADYAALRYPRPLPLDAVRSALDPGTLLLEYAVGAEKTLLFIVRPATAAEPGIEIREIPIGGVALTESVEEYRRLVSTPLSDPLQLADRSRRLYGLLLAPAAGAIARAERILLSPDGPLHSLPFAALTRPGGETLAGWKALHSTPSATVYAQGRRRRHRAVDPQRLRVAAFGDPVYAPGGGGWPGRGAGPPAAGASGAARTGEISLAPLPASRREVDGIRALFPATRAYLGANATESAALALDRSVDLVHFAVHALLDAQVPARSSLVLSLPIAGAGDGTDGRLEVGEILSGLHLDASLVTLSACQTALGREMGGEGLVGLTRAFLFAGARAVLGSLWSVGDGPTALVMERFYAGLRAGLTKDAALREAQVAMLRDPATSHPSNWAGFVLVGDFR